MYKFIFTFIFAAILSLNSTAQAQTPTKTKLNHHLGLHTSSLGGLGFSYRYWPGKMGVQVTALPVFRKKKGHFVSLAANLLYTLKEGRKVDLYTYTGIHYVGVKSSEFTSNQGVITSNKSESINLGLGIGFKINLTEFLNLNLQTGYGFYNINNDFISTMAGGVGLYYSF
mgnify:CR=1 FL=1